MTTITATRRNTSNLGTLKQIAQAFRAYQVSRNEFINVLTVRACLGAKGGF
jgi:hypothetical protein